MRRLEYKEEEGCEWGGERRTGQVKKGRFTVVH